MKKIAYVLGVAGLFAFVLAVAAKLFHIGGASILIGYGTIFNEIIVLPFIAFYLLRNNSKNKSIYILGVLSVFILIAGLFFKIQHWPGSFVMSILGIVLFFISTILFSNLLYKRDWD